MLNEFKTDSWLDWIYNKQKDNFFFLCDSHTDFIRRVNDGVLETKLAQSMPCDYPGCNYVAVYEYFPNLFPQYKNYGQQNKEIHNISTKKNMAMVKRKKERSKCSKNRKNI